jgi:hypothetical protein
MEWRQDRVPTESKRLSSPKSRAWPLGPVDVPDAREICDSASEVGYAAGENGCEMDSGMRTFLLPVRRFINGQSDSNNSEQIDRLKSIGLGSIVRGLVP